jgi:uncharacterized protein with GYD domain
MAQFLTLLRFTDQGLREVAASPRRADEFCRRVQEKGGKILVQTWALGAFDGIVVFEAKDDAQAAELMLGLAKQGFVRTKTVRLLTEQEFAAVAGR